MIDITFEHKPFSVGFFSCLLCLIFVVSTSSAMAQKDCIPVDLTQVDTTDLEETIEGIGTLEAKQRVTLKPEVSGTIEEVHFEEGSPVDKGQLLVSLEDDMYQAQYRAKEAALAQAQAELTNQRRVFERRQRLFAQNQISEEVKDEAETKFETAKATVNRLEAEQDQIRETLEDTRIRAPFPGRMGELLVDPGNWVDIGTSLSTVTQSRELRIAFTLPEKFIGQIQTGQLARVRVPAYPERHFQGQVYFISPQIEASSRTLLVKANMDNPEEVLKPGGFASVQLQVGIRENVLVIPEEALVPTRTGYMVFAVQDGRAHGREVDIGLRKPGKAEITGGLQEGQDIIRSGHINVQEGAQVCPAQKTND
ncbi:MAG: efflux RND transporter periplasmic adaptor subunit [Desulfovermiculus sp.]|nr:efflux RND transporter periplasmic adaptor subunit [Desulfovermiculus sp.]